MPLNKKAQIHLHMLLTSVVSRVLVGHFSEFEIGLVVEILIISVRVCGVDVLFKGRGVEWWRGEEQETTGVE